MKYLLILFLTFGLYAGEVVIDDYTIVLPDYDENIDLTDVQQDEVTAILKGQKKLIHKELKALRNNYKGNKNRGTVKYTKKCKNYSFHKVKIPDGEVVKDCNFTQKNPDTNAIRGDYLILKDCNIFNVRVNPTWTLIRTYPSSGEVD